MRPYCLSCISNRPFNTIIQTARERPTHLSSATYTSGRKEGRKELKYIISSLGLTMMDKFRRISLSWLVEKTMIGKEDIMNKLCKYYAAFSSLIHQEGRNKKRQDCTDVDLLKKRKSKLATKLYT
jgi:hypothetical protein